MSKPVLHIDRLCYRYQGQDELALDDISLDVERGEFVVVTGPSGCGKSTLAMAIGGYLAHQFKGEFSGAVNVAGVNTLKESLFWAADVVGLVQQNPEDQFCTLCVDDEVAFGPENRRVPPAELDGLVSRSLQRASAEHLRGRTLDTLSGGEKQRVALASMLAGDPDLLILDEPTASLDPQATRSVLDALDVLRREQGLTLVVIEHKLAMLERFQPRVVRMLDGRIIDDHSSIEIPPDIVHVPSPVGEAVVDLANVNVILEHRQVLSDVSMRFYAGQMTAIMGPNGSGKTTLLRVIRGLQALDSGSVKVFGNDIQQRKASFLADRVGFMFQNPDHQLLGDSVLADVAYGLDPQEFSEDRAYIDNLLADADLESIASRHPFSLSYGQKRRLNLVSTLARRPGLLLVDEPLVGQDPENAAYVMGALEQVAERGVAVVAVLHSPGMILQYADRVIFVENGRVLVDAEPLTAFSMLKSQGYSVFAGVR